MLKIEKGIPIPPRFRSKEGTIQELVETLNEMLVGDSVIIPPKQRGALNFYIGLAKKDNKVFTTRMIGDDLRCWRIG